MSNNKEEQEPAWSSARVIFGRLIEIDKKSHCITLEYKEDQEWTTENFGTGDWTDEDYAQIRDALGDDISLTVEDSRALSWDRER